jgi:hypothetical protein
MTPDEAVELLVNQFGDCFDRHAKMFFHQDALQYIRDVAHQAHASGLEQAATLCELNGKLIRTQGRKQGYTHQLTIDTVDAAASMFDATASDIRNMKVQS